MIILIILLLLNLFIAIKKLIALKDFNISFSVKLSFDNKRFTHILSVLFVEALWLIFYPKNIILLYVSISLAVFILFIALSHSVYDSENSILVTHLGQKFKVNKIETDNEKSRIKFIVENDEFTKYMEYTIYNKKRYNTILSQISND